MGPRHVQLQHTATHCILEGGSRDAETASGPIASHMGMHYTLGDTPMGPRHVQLQHTATHCNTLQHTATHCNTLQHTATHCNTLQHTAYLEAEVAMQKEQLVPLAHVRIVN